MSHPAYGGGVMYNSIYLPIYKQKKYHKQPGHSMSIHQSITPSDTKLVKIWHKCFPSWISWLGWVGFYGISTIVGYLMPNPFLCKSVLFKLKQFSLA